MRYEINQNNRIYDSKDKVEYENSQSLCDELNRLDDELQQTKKLYKKCLFDKQKMKNELVRLQVKMELKE